MNLAKLLNGTSRKALHTYRYTTRAVLRRENIAEHQWIVSFYSLVIAKWLIKSGYSEVDIGKLLSKCVVHDIEESVTGDFLRKIKHANPEIHSAIEELGQQVVSDLDEELHLDCLVGLWSTSKDSSIEGQILRLADAMAVVSYLIEERQMGNRTLSDVNLEVLDHLNTGVAPKMHADLLLGLCAETTLYLCEQCEIEPHPVLVRKVNEFRECQNSPLRRELNG